MHVNFSKENDIPANINIVKLKQDSLIVIQLCCMFTATNIGTRMKNKVTNILCSSSHFNFNSASQISLTKQISKGGKAPGKQVIVFLIFSIFGYSMRYIKIINRYP